MEKFDQVRDILDRQYEEIFFPPDTGTEKDSLQKKAMEYVAVHWSEPYVITRAEVLAMLLEECRVGVCKADVFPNFFEKNKAIDQICNFWLAQAESKFDPELLAFNKDQIECGGANGRLDLSHTCPDWESLLSLGIPGLYSRAEAAMNRAQTKKEKDFCRAVMRVYKAFRTLVLKLAAESERNAMPEAAANLRYLADHAPDTLQQALHLMLLYDNIQEYEGELVRTQGRFDQLYLNFYRRDLERNILNRESAKELLKYFWMKHYAQYHGKWVGKNYVFGGCDKDGNDACNELTELALETYFELKLPDPKLIFRYSAQTPEKYMALAARCVTHGMTAIVFSNDDVIIPGFLKQGKTLEDARDYLLIGCYEPGIGGREMPCTMAGVMNIAKYAELSLTGGRDLRTGKQIGPAGECPASFADYEAEFFRQMEYSFGKMIEAAKAYEAAWPSVNPSPFLSGIMRDCMEKLEDVSVGGMKYSTSGIMCGCIASAADSLAAVKYLLEDAKLCDMKTLREAVEHNWEGYEKLRMEAQYRAPKWGNGNPDADVFARKILEKLGHLAEQYTNVRGGRYKIGNWSINWNMGYGVRTSAFPDGHLAGEVLSRNNNAVCGMDKAGITALMRSVTSVDQQIFMDGSILDLMLHPSAVSGSDGDEILCSLVRSFAKLGGQCLQFNILDVETLKKAQRDPARYNSIQIRVCGWNNRFVDLSEAEQKNFIAQAEAMV